MEALQTLYVVVPCYNEQEVLSETAKRLKTKLENLLASKKISSASKIIFVDDGSKDQTWQMIEMLSEEDSIFGGLKLSRNRGHQNALLAGLMTAKDHADVVISMDADLQDDIEAVDAMIEAGLVDEVRALQQDGCTRDMVSMQGLGYKEILAYLDGGCTLEEAVYIIKRETRHFAKRQLTWFKRERDVIWLDKQAFGYDDAAILKDMISILEEKEIISHE